MNGPTNNRRDGHTLIELMVVVAIIGLAGLLAVPSYLDRLPDRRLSQAAWQVYMDLQEAKALAVSQNAPVEISFVSADGKYTIWVDANQNGSRDAGEEEDILITDIPTATFTAHPTTATFLPSGTVITAHHYHYVRLSVPSAGTKYIYTFPNGHIDPYLVQYM